MLPIKPEVCTLPDGRIGLFLGADYKLLTRDAATALCDKLIAELDKLPRTAPEGVALRD